MRNFCICFISINILSLGPTEYHEEVLLAMASRPLSHVDPKFIAEMGESLELMRSVFKAPKDAQPVILAGSGSMGYVTCACAKPCRCIGGRGRNILVQHSND
jgi:aspartate aminotransferase-like enzyme